MLAAVRQTRIMDELRRTGGVRVSDLTELLGVSDMTIRRDLEALHARGLLAKVHGGAMAVDGTSTFEPAFEAKVVRERHEKDAIARRALALVRPGMSVGVGGGTTTWALARHLTAVDGLTVVTNSLPVADVLHAAGHEATVIITGGQRTPSNALVGPVAVQTVSLLHLDLVLLGAHGIDAGAGLTTPNLAEAEINRAFVQAGGRLAVLADHTKFGTVALAGFAALSEVTTLITDRADGEAAGTIQGLVGELLTVDDDADGDLQATGGRHGR